MVKDRAEKASFIRIWYLSSLRMEMGFNLVLGKSKQQSREYTFKKSEYIQILMIQSFTVFVCLHIGKFYLTVRIHTRSQNSQFLRKIECLSLQYTAQV